MRPAPGPPRAVSWPKARRKPNGVRPKKSPTVCRSTRRTATRSSRIAILSLPRLRSHLQRQCRRWCRRRPRSNSQSLSLRGRSMRLARALIALAFLAVGSTAWGQGAILQGGATTPGHVPMYVGQGTSQPVVQDSGSAGGGGPGLGLSEFLQVNRTTTGTGPLGSHNCFYDNPTTTPGGYHYFCLDANAQGGGLITYGAGGAASALPLAFN